MTKRLESKVAIITGSGGGIGKAVTQTYANEGAKVVIAGFDENALNKKIEQLKDDALGITVITAVAS